MKLRKLRAGRYEIFIDGVSEGFITRSNAGWNWYCAERGFGIGFFQTRGEAVAQALKLTARFNLRPQTLSPNLP